MRDQTDRLRRHLADQLQPGEEVLAGVGLSLPGTGAAALSGAATASTGGTVYVEGGKLPKAKKDAEKAGLERWPHWFLVLTSQRVVVVRRSALNRPKQVQLAAPLEQVVTLTVSKQGSPVKVALEDGRTLRFETPKAMRFLPPVYTQLSALFVEAKDARKS